MIKHRERTLKDSISSQAVTPELRGNSKMRGPVDRAKQDLVTHMLR
ncbi:hypothetical protein CASFOL_001772 [Castilleja foliolosa]|uniref:Uncharacterized protein n=1 Tax=Castilleja foliolosa TaxID=1961234 RepID=A0ABD3EFY3_9LAMI